MFFYVASVVSQINNSTIDDLKRVNKIIHTVKVKLYYQDLGEQVQLLSTYVSFGKLPNCQIQGWFCYIFDGG